jgi:hypothetical protein
LTRGQLSGVSGCIDLAEENTRWRAAIYHLAGHPDRQL